MVKTKMAENFFHGKEGYNCAQAILKTFQQEFLVDEHLIEEASQKGRGKADGGICGALYAALQLLTNDKQLQQKLTTSFYTKGESKKNDLQRVRKACC